MSQNCPHCDDEPESMDDLADHLTDQHQDELAQALGIGEAA